ncbi:ATP-grasp domain-containing protein [Pseudomonas syringae]|uniref:ATP-grasp domain-containing protein n=1 Tax=Pseudomonas syringae TaxID=317 RepID=UPI001F16E07C|nr:ATP-grasp domain-containing protein [Pseudomonas syringae]MCF5720842.1 carboxylate--amine ligase [Pseudomonas syringae]
MIWFLEGQSSQRDIIQGARDALPPDVKIFASHRDDRPEITAGADISFTEPRGDEERISWVISTARTYGIKVILTGRLGGVFEQARPRFEQAGLVLVTGGMSMRTFDLVDDKSKFTVEAERAGLACVPAITATNADEMFAAYKTLAASGEVCVKPAVGIYGQGFWRFKEGADPFRCFADPDARVANFETYMHAYCDGGSPPAMLVMPYMAGSECSVDMVCEAGRAVSFVARRKTGVHQIFEKEGRAVELALKAAEHFQCDGIVNVQTKDDVHGHPHLLEINPRYSGGVGYTREAGVNLAGIFATRRLNLPEPATVWRPDVRVKGVTVAAVVPK